LPEKDHALVLTNTVVLSRQTAQVIAQVMLLPVPAETFGIPVFRSPVCAQPDDEALRLL